MVALGAKYLMDVQRMGRILSEIDGVNELRGETLRILDRVVGSARGNFFLIKREKQRPDFTTVQTRGVEERYLRLYRRYYHSMDPFARTLGVSVPDVVTTDQLVAFRSFVRTEYYNDFLKPQNIHYQMVLNLRSGRDLIGVVALFRPWDSSNFSDLEQTKASLMTPWISMALERAILSERLEQREAALEAILHDLPQKGILLLDASMEPIYWDETANGILSHLVGKNWAGIDPADLLPKSLYHRCTNLRTGPGTESRTPSRTQRIEWTSPCTGQRIFVRFREIACGKHVLFLFCFDPEAQILGHSGRLKQMGLTIREIDVVLLLAQGLKNGEIAKRLFISEHTVENHLKAIYRKTEVKNRSTLIHRLAIR